MLGVLDQLLPAQSVGQVKMAKAVGVMRQTIIAIERGKYLPLLKLALKIAEYFNMKVEDIFYLGPCETPNIYLYLEDFAISPNQPVPPGGVL